MDELEVKFIYNGEISFLKFLKNIKLDVKDKFDKHVWSGQVKVGNEYIFTEKEKSFANILFKIYLLLQNEKGVLVEMNLWYKS